MNVRSRVALCFFLALLPPCAVGANFNGTVIWYISTTGSDSNGGGFDPGVGSPGTNMATGSAVAFTDLVLATSTTAASVTLGFASASVGNTIHITGGSGCTVGVYEILSQAAGTATFNASMGTATDTCSGNAYGSFATVCSAASASKCSAGAFAWPVGQATIYIQTGTYGPCSALISNNCYENANAVNAFSFCLIGYYQTPGDISPSANLSRRPVLTITASDNMFQDQQQACYWNLVLQTTGSAASPLIVESENHIWLFNDKLDGSGASGTGGYGLLYLDETYGATIQDTEFVCYSGASSYAIRDDGGGAFSSAVVTLGPGTYIHGCTAGLWDDATSNAHHWVVTGATMANNTIHVDQAYTGAAQDFLLIRHSSFYNSSTSNPAVSVNTSFADANVSMDNSIVDGASYGLYVDTNIGGAASTIAARNAFHNIGTADYNVVQTRVPPYNSGGTGPLPDIALGSCSPFNNPSSNDFSLSSCGKTALSGVGFPGVSPGGTGYATPGAMQPQATSSGGAAPHAIVQ